MFIHQGKKRKPKHNIQIASLLSFVAGIVNVAGFLAVATLTTNVTGHFAFFVEEIFKLSLWQSFIYFLYVFFFFFGSFLSSLLVEISSRKNDNLVYIIPTTIESLLLLGIAIFGKNMLVAHPNFIACGLLFAMGLQNSLVTRISNATVRTTHLTGLFTDLGIELAQLFFYKDTESRAKLLAAVKLRLTIISFFFIGGITGGIFYAKLGLHVLLIGSVSLFLGMMLDNIRLRIKLIQKKYHI